MQLKNIKSVGNKTLNILNNLNINNVEDLLTYYPYRYNFVKLFNISNIDESNNYYIKADVVSEAKVMYIKRNFNRLSFKVVSDNIELNVTIFNRAFLKQHINIGKEIILFGKYNKLKNSFTAADIKFNLTDNSIEPIYHLTNGIKQVGIKKIIENALNTEYDVLDKVPNYINEEYKFINKNLAIKYIHKPSSVDEVKKAKLKLIYEELFEFMFKVNYLKIKKQSDEGIKRNIDNKLINDFITSLPFEPTTDQEKAFNEIKEDMTTSKRMNRLVLGDVGSGKTLVATYSIYLNYITGYQSAFMAPTEILAKQHYLSLIKFFENYNITIDIITGKMSKKEKDNIKDRLHKGEIDLLIGTHSIINDDVIFNNLGLVITDEQHRFGVLQRQNLENKGINPDILYLSATPIPRTYALILYGDSDVSIIKTKPKGRKDIITKIVKEDNIKEVLEKISEEINNNRQIFIVSPLIENEESELNSVAKLKDKFSSAFNNKKIDIIHGALKQEQKDMIMQKFANNETNMLISTTVIEVGIDVPNASIIVIYNAERFGLATLHQLRGRVGRGNNDSYCYLISDNDNKRLKVMEESNDGFYITEKDYEERREGDLFGTKQSGDMVFKIADLKKDYQIVLRVQKDSEEFVKEELYKQDNYYLDLINQLNNLT